METFLHTLENLKEDQITDTNSIKTLFTFDITHPQVAAIHNDLVSKSEKEISSKVDNTQILSNDWPALTQFVKAYCFWCACVDEEHSERCFEWYAKCFQTMQQAYSNVRGACLNLVIKELTKVMFNLFGYKGKNYLDFLSSILLRLLNSVRSEREPYFIQGPSKKENILFYANMLSRIYFKTNNLVSANSVFANMHSVGVHLKQFSMAEQVEYRYWAGRHAIYKLDANLAFNNLSFALQNCLFPSNQYNLIWDHILVVAILVGKLPTFEALQSVPLDENALKAVDLLLSCVRSGCNLESTLDELRNNKYIQKKNLFPLIETQLPLLAYRRMLQRIQIRLNARRIKFELLAKLAGLDDASLVKTEGIIYQLNERDMIKTNVLPQSLQCLVKQGGAFPPLVREVREEWME